MNDVNADTVLAALQRRIGHDRGVSAKALAAELHTHERRIRTLISALREDGIAVCGTPSTGYYIAETAHELEQCCAWLRSRTMHTLRLESRMRRIPMADLVGQLKLPT